MKTRHPVTDIGSLSSEQVAEQQLRIKRGILSIIDIILVLGQRGIPFRGNWDRKEKSEDGNFAFFVNWKSTFHKDLKEHVQADNAKYTSPKIQNEIIHICEEIIRERIISCIPKYWGIITQDCSMSEQVSICIRYITDVGDICADFMGFVKLDKMDAQTIADTLISTVQQWGLDMSYLIAQAYDGASVMSSGKNGVQAKVRGKYPFATYVHCRSHVLSLAIVSGCKNVPSIRNLFDNVEKLTWFISGSAKRKEIFLRIASCEGDGQELVHLLTEGDEGELLKLSRKEEGRNMCLNVVLLVGLQE